ncbi:tetratricopeptide repeat protein [Marinobacter pelagius]|uniref:tetratricopeptide repeat protein n=1 Tax=Marinobacter sp. C7 TaxID=2951363 RepID=UPI001EF07D11|nr:tetratricopeptide repeat protein [Marinobacter sp. C7]MCG7201396.1 tetratricopeptide repeat protein [Marinobacter sp. C7]
MSLLNDALRAAEKRQQKPEAPAAYTGQGYTVPTGKNRLVPVLLMLVVVLAAVSGYALMGGNQGVPETAEAPESLPPVSVQSADNATESPVHQEQEDRDAEVAAEKPAAEPVNVREPEPITAKVAEEAPESAPGNAPAPAPEPKSDPAPAPEKQVAQKKRSEPEKAAVSQAQPVEPETEPAQVKEARETPESIDRRVSRELASLLRQGRSRDAAERLRSLLAEQPAPVSRATLARALLVEGQPEIALAWLPASEVMTVPELRLLRARALLATGELDGAVTVLRSQIPPLQGHIEYRVTLATLLQQAGESGEAAEQWTALLTTDDSRAAWWVGLGISLESQGKAASAQRAYAQAAALPGLSPSLADYVRERLKQLQAG